MYIGKETLEKLEKLSKISAGKNGVTRFYLTKEYIEARELIQGWMEEIGLVTYVDTVGNLIGEYKSKNPEAKTLVLGSHQDTVKEGGAFDGILGVILPIVCVKNILQENKEIDCNIKIISFAYEEGITFKNACLTSKAITGAFTEELLELEDENGKKLRDAMLEYGFNPQNIEKSRFKKGEIDAFLEIHIEQGPVLVHEKKAVGIVTAIQACKRYKLNIKGEAGHSGTIPMKMRKDAGRTMAEIICQSSDLVEEMGNIVLTFGKIDVKPGVVNIIPGEAEAIIDIRAMKSEILAETMEKIEKLIKNITSSKKMEYSLTKINEILETECSSSIIKALEESFENTKTPMFKLSSGAGHDAQEMKEIAEVGMLFVRCKDGISHNPAEEATENDINVAGKIVIDFIKNFK